MPAPLFLHCVNVPARYNELDVADEFWSQNIAWVSMVLMTRTEDPTFNHVHIEISGWLSDIKFQIDYKNCGTIKSNIGIFQSVFTPQTYSSYANTLRELHKDKCMEFPLRYFIDPPGIRYSGSCPAPIPKEEDDDTPLFGLLISSEEPEPKEESPPEVVVYCYKKPKRPTLEDIVIKLLKREDIRRRRAIAGY